MKNIKKIDLKKYPYRGLMIDIAKEMNVSPQNIAAKYHRNNPEILKRLADKVEIKRKEIESYHKRIAK